jgi:hypothetical protein
MTFLTSVIALLSLLPLVARADGEATINTSDPIFWVKIVVIIILVILSGIVAGTEIILIAFRLSNLY